MALEHITEAQSLLDDQAPAALRARVGSSLAKICYDQGDRESLERALEELTAAVRELRKHGDSRAAARLLNDQAAVLVRLGDFPRAHHLLSESRNLFEGLIQSDPSAGAELAQTDHLLSRLTLHVAPREGREGDAIDVGLEHAVRAERRYEELGDGRERARVRETMGRMLLRAGRLDEAAELLQRAARTQDQLGDVIGLARTADGLFEVLAVAGQARDAVAVLERSIELNLEKGSLIGLAYNRRALHRLLGALDDHGRHALEGELRTTLHSLTEAERVLGVAELPPQSVLPPVGEDGVRSTS